MALCHSKVSRSNQKGYHPVPAGAAPPRRPVLDGSPAVYMSYMSQNFCLFPVSSLSVLNFRIFLLMYPEYSETRRVAATNKVPGDRGLIDSGPEGPRRPVLEAMLSRRTLSRRGTT